MPWHSWQASNFKKKTSLDVKLPKTNGRPWQSQPWLKMYLLLNMVIFHLAMSDYWRVILIEQTWWQWWHLGQLPLDAFFFDLERKHSSRSVDGCCGLYWWILCTIRISRPRGTLMHGRVLSYNKCHYQAPPFSSRTIQHPVGKNEWLVISLFALHVFLTTIYFSHSLLTRFCSHSSPLFNFNSLSNKHVLNWTSLQNLDTGVT